MNFIMTASLVLAAVAAIVLFFLGMKYPRGRKDWPHDRERTFRYIMSGALFFIILGLIYWVTRYWDYPLSAEGVFYLSLVLFTILVVLGLIFPKGRKDLLE
mgnify:CR=1 FL=1